MIQADDDDDHLGFDVKDSQIGTNVSEKYTTSIFRTEILQNVSKKILYLPINLNGIKTQNNTVILTIMKTSVLT